MVDYYVKLDMRTVAFNVLKLEVSLINYKWCKLIINVASLYEYIKHLDNVNGIL